MKALSIASCISILVAAIVMIVWRLQNPEMTETQTFLEWWWLILPMIGLAALVAYLEAPR